MCPSRRYFTSRRVRKQGQLVGNGGLGQVQHLRHTGHGAFPLGQQIQDPNPRRISQGFENLRNLLHRFRGRWVFSEDATLLPPLSIYI